MFNHLHRNINTSKKYDKYFKKSTCTPTSIGSGNTKFGVNAMKEFALKHRYQTKKLTKEVFTTNNLKDLTKQIHQFLYHTFQFKADTTNQNLKSPNCSYSSRFDGIECKSYSILAATILLNKGIKFYFRRIQQSQDQANQYTHVYVIVPKNQQNATLTNGYYVIDGNNYNQVEVPFVKSKDIIMESNLPYYGLNAPQLTTAHQLINNLDSLLTNLEKLGVSKKTLINFKNAVNHYTSKGIDPYIQKAESGIYVGDIHIVFELENKGLNGWGTLVGPAISGGITTPVSSIGGGLPSTLPLTSSSSSGSSGGAGNFLSGILNSGESGGNSGVAGAGASIALDAATGGMGSTVAGLLGFDIGETIGHIFNGSFDCIGGSGWHNGDMTERTPKFEQFVQQRVNAINSTRNVTLIEDKLNELTRGSYTMRDGHAGILADGWNSCSSKVLKSLAEMGKTGIDAVNGLVETLKRYGLTVEVVERKYNVDPRNGLWTLLNMKQKYRGEKVSYPVYKVSGQFTVNDTVTTPSNSGAGNTSVNQNIPNNNQQTATKSNPLTGMLIAAAGAKLLGVF